MKIDRDKLTPEALIEMRFVLIQGGVDPTKLTDDEVVEKFEHLGEAVVELGKKLSQFMAPISHFMQEFAKSPTVHHLRRLQSELAVQAYDNRYPG